MGLLTHFAHSLVGRLKFLNMCSRCYRVSRVQTRCLSSLETRPNLHLVLQELSRNCDGQLKAAVCKDAAAFEHRMNLGSKPIYHLEAFVAKFMATYKEFLETGFDMNMMDDDF